LHIEVITVRRKLLKVERGPTAPVAHGIRQGNRREKIRPCTFPIGFRNSGFASNLISIGAGRSGRRISTKFKTKGFRAKKAAGISPIGDLPEKTNSCP